MSTLREAAQQALEALEEYQAKGAPFWSCDAAVAALRAALEQPEQEQAPACWVTVFGLAALRNGRSASVRVYAENGGSDVPLYTRGGA